jgi:hydroxymethylglutaryl-CoA lyase
VNDLPDTITITDVALRDGLQIQDVTVPTREKIAIIDGLIAAGISAIEATSFVHPGLVPQMADADQLWPQLPAATGVRFSGLVPNVRGARRALAAGCRDIVLVLSASEGHAQANTHRSVAAGIDEAEAILGIARDVDGASVSVGIATAFVCPFDGDVPPEQVRKLVAGLFGLGIRHIRLADTIGKADPVRIRALADIMTEEFPQVHFALHLHNTYGTGMANVYAGMQSGIVDFDAALGGIGGCPFAPGAAGNIATEDIVYMSEQMGVSTGIELPELASPAARLRAAIGHPLDSSVSRALGW